ncbi:hypothetical protein RB2150_15960 [Rhodobacterales bacterium HTCC2150]|jgi:hypothetical protein|nr:hypothetical protein RB2150_15960 [Rhodobacterales bacterium HTCC2150] [Rhodobacteraceae bacterium HTCC2150]
MTTAKNDDAKAKQPQGGEARHPEKGDSKLPLTKTTPDYDAPFFASILMSNQNRRHIDGQAWGLAGATRQLPNLASYESLTPFWPAVWGLVQ